MLARQLAGCLSHVERHVSCPLPESIHRFINICANNQQENIPEQLGSQAVRDTKVIQTFGLALRETLEERWHGGGRANGGGFGEEVNILERPLVLCYARNSRYLTYGFDGAWVRVLHLGFHRLVEVEVFAAIERVQGLKRS